MGYDGVTLPNTHGSIESGIARTTETRQQLRFAVTPRAGAELRLGR